MSQESGIPTFRDENGEYKDEEMLNMLQGHVMKRNPGGVVRYLKNHRGKVFDGIKPNKGHYALAELSQTHDLRLVTQNIDGLMERAVEDLEYDFIPISYLHGNWNHIRCQSCFSYDNEAEMGDECEHCNGVMRPDIVLFGEPLDEDVFEGAAQSVQRSQVCLLLGTSGMVYPAASLPSKAKEAGATLIEINPSETDLSGICDIRIREKAGKALTSIMKSLRVPGNEPGPEE